MRTKYLLSVLVIMVLMVIGYSTMAMPESSESTHSGDDKKPGVLSTGVEDQIRVLR